MLKVRFEYSFLNMAGLAAARISGGSEFHAAGPACEKAHSPNLVRSRVGLLAAGSRSQTSTTRSSATARPSCLVGVLYDIYRETINKSTANQPLLRSWPRKLPNSAK